MVTTLSDRDSRLKGLNAGADDFISKPFDRIELRVRVQTITKLNRYRRLQFERAKFEWAISQAEEGYVVLDKAGRLSYANPSARLFLELAEQDPPDSAGTFADVTAAYHRHPAEAWESWPGKDSACPRYLVRPETEHARAFWLRVDVLDTAAIPDGNRVIRLSNVTEQIIQARDRRSFQSLISHKLRTPLIGMRSGLEFLQQMKGDLSPDEEAGLVSGALAGAVRLHNDVEGIVNFLTRTSSPGQTCHTGQLPSLVAALCESMSLPPARVSLAPELAAVELPLSEPDCDLILRELLGNAKKFHPDKQPQLEISMQPAGPQQVSLTVSDDGLTLSPEQLHRALMPYVQGEKYFTGQVPGMGLGLALVSSLLWGVGGECFIRNRTPGPGVTVTLQVPVRA
jgi:signal transduction histidine kinase